MSLPVTPDAATVLRNSIANLRDVVLPGVSGEWERMCASITVGALEYALAVLNGGRDARHLEELAATTTGLDGSQGESPYEVASRLLIWGQRNPGDRANQIKEVLHPVLMRQLDEELTASMPLMAGLMVAMRGSR